MLGLKSRWWIVAASAFSLACSPGSVAVFTNSVFLKPITQDLHIGRGTYGSALFIAALIGGALLPFIGYLLDRFGSRRVLLTGTVFFSLGSALQFFLTASPWVLYPLTIIRSMFDKGQSPIAHSAVVTKWFDRKRGLAIGIAMAGTGIGTVFLPPIIGYTIDAVGWRLTFVVLGAICLAVAWLPVFLFTRDPKPEEMEEASVGKVAAPLPGMTLKEAMQGTWHFWALAIIFFLGVTALNGVLQHVVAFMQDRGLSLPEAAAILGVSGIGSILGRLVVGYLTDRFFAPYVAAGAFLVPMVGIALFASGAGGIVPLIASAFCGFGIGAEIDLMAFMVGRYFGLKSFGVLLGVLHGVFSAFSGLGTFISGMSFDRFHSYTPAFILYEAMLFAICVTFLFFGPYRYPVRTTVPAAI
ncbi:MAG: MFS transporter [Candidatus Paceibacterota bacterium]